MRVRVRVRIHLGRGGRGPYLLTYLGRGGRGQPQDGIAISRDESNPSGSKRDCEAYAWVSR